MDLAFKVLEQYGLAGDTEGECWWEYADKRNQAHWRCQVGTARYTVHITPVGNPVNYVTDGWNFRANVAQSRYAEPAAEAEALDATEVASPSVDTEVCFGPYTLEPVVVPPVTIPATTIAGVHYPAKTFPGRTLPGRTLPRHCFSIDRSLLSDSTVRVSDYEAIDSQFDNLQSESYWTSAGPSANVPDFAAPGFGELNGAGFPKNQYVRSYFRRDGTYVRGYWRNSPGDGLPTCKIIRC